jgi:predicted O-linked N-acetylglucosamine transferase (SPINDLY family)
MAVYVMRRALAQAPLSAMALSELGVALSKDDQMDEAIEMLLKATQVEPDFPEAHAGLGNALADGGRILEGIESYRRALSLRPNWHSVHSNLLYMMPFFPRYGEQAIYEEAQAWSGAYAEPLDVVTRDHKNDRSVERRLRVGYVSPHFFHHCQSFFTLPLLTHHNRDQVEIFCYSSVENPDDLTRQFQLQVENWRDVLRLNDAELAELVQRDGIDILLDLTMHMENGRLPMFALKPAPVQISWLAYPGTTGVRAVDYRVTDRFLDPPDSFPRPHYAERSLILPNTFWCYDPLECDLEPGPLPAIANGHVTFGNLNHFRKFHEGVIELWAQVLRAVENSRMLILAPQGQSRERLRALFQQQEIGPSRISFTSRLPRQDYLRLYQQIDIGLDSFPYGGHTTSLDAFWMGVPVISLLGSTIVGRAGVTIASNLQMESLIARTSEEFVQTARALAAELPHLQETRLTLRSRMASSPLMDQARFARNMENAFRTAWRIWCKGDPCDSSPLIIADR